MPSARSDAAGLVWMYGTDEFCMVPPAQPRHGIPAALTATEEWIEHFRHMGVKVLLNDHTVIRKGRAALIVGGVVPGLLR